jgi:hypothetical protein
LNDKDVKSAAQSIFSYSVYFSDTTRKENVTSITYTYGSVEWLSVGLVLVVSCTVVSAAYHSCLPACRNGSIDDEGARKLPVALKFRKVSEETNKQCAQAGSVTTTFDLMSVSLVGLVLGNSSGISALRTCVYV